MDVGGQRGGGRHRFDNLRDYPSAWNAVNHHQVKDQNTLNFNKKLNIIAERDAAIEERNKALLEKKKALEEREAAISQRNSAINELNDAVIERDNALIALDQYMRHSLGFDIQHGTNSPYNGTSEMQILDALCRTVVKRPKENKGHASNAVKPRKGKRVREDLNRVVAGDQLKLRNNWDGQNLALNRVDFDESVMQIPGCSCTGVFRHCYKWGNGGWQSSCCTTTMSLYPLPPMPNKRYARMGGRKMSGSAFSKLLTRLASEGYDLSRPVDLKDNWSKHGTNRYITIK